MPLNLARISGPLSCRNVSAAPASATRPTANSRLKPSFEPFSFVEPFIGRRPLGCRTINPDRRRLARACPNRKEESVQLGHEERSPSTGSGSDPIDATILRPLDREHVEEPGPAADVDAVALLIEEHVIAVAAGLDARDRGSVLHRKGGESRGLAEDREHALALPVEGHREVPAERPRRPFCKGAPRR